MDDDDDIPTPKIAKLLPDPDDIPTPRVTGSFVTLHAQALDLSRKFQDIATLKEKTLFAYDREGAATAKRLSHELLELAKRFAMWPSLHAETLALERDILTGRLDELRRACVEMLATTPTSLVTKPGR